MAGFQTTKYIPKEFKLRPYSGLREGDLDKTVTESAYFFYNSSKFQRLAFVSLVGACNFDNYF